MPEARDPDNLHIVGLLFETRTAGKMAQKCLPSYKLCLYIYTNMLYIQNWNVLCTYMKVLIIYLLYVKANGFTLKF